MTIAVNRAAVLWCDLLAAYDPEALAAWRGHARSGSVTLDRNVTGDGCRAMSLFDPPEWARGFTKHGAVVVAVALGATEVELHGDGREGKRYFDGAENAAAGAGRWKWERDGDAKMEAWLADRGVKFRRVLPPLVVSYATPEYETELDGLRATLVAHGLPHRLVRRPSLGSWARNCAQKATVLAEALASVEDGRLVAWLDADSRVIARPDVLWSLDCDVARHLLRGREFLSGTLLLRNSEPVRRLVDAWISGCHAAPTEWDQRVLARVIDGRGLVVADLPVEYVRLPWMTDVAPVIEHRQASRTHRPVIDGTLPVKYAAVTA